MFNSLKPVWNRWVALGAIIVTGALCAVWGLLILIINPQTQMEKYPAAFVTVIPAPTQTLVITISSAKATPTQSATYLPSSGILVGKYVQISGTGGDGLRLRAGPGTTYKLNIVGMEQEVFWVIEGPTEGDGFTWFYLAAPYDSARGGWAVSKYLVVIEQPR